MNLHLLDFIVSRQPGLIAALARRHQLYEVASIGVANLLLAKRGALDALTPRQKMHYELCIKPLLEDAPREVDAMPGDSSRSARFDSRSFTGS